MLAVVLSGIVVSILLLFSKNFFHHKKTLLLTLLPLSLFLYFIQLIYSGSPIPYKESYPWIHAFQIHLDFYLDGLSLIFALLITGIGTLVFFYSSSYMHHDESRFFGFLSLFMAAMLGMVLSDNLIVFFIFWELTSISSFFLIGFDRENDESRRSAVIALATTGGGGLFLLVGLILLGSVAGTLSFSELTTNKNLIQNHPYYGSILFFILMGAFTKSAQFPFQYWLPGAMKAPTPVSTYLHSATMVKAGVYLIARLTPVLGDEYYWNTTLTIFGGITMLIGAIRSVFHTDLKSILAYTTVSALGTLVFLLGLGTQDSFLAASVFILVHALYKAGFFLTAGILDHNAGTRDITKLKGLGPVMAPVFVGGALLALSNAGIPPMFGFLAKDLIYEATLHNPISWLILVPFIVNVFLSISGYLVGIRPFIGKPILNLQEVHKPSPILWIPPILLSILGIVYGIYPNTLEKILIIPALDSLGTSYPNLHLALFHGISPVLYWSGATIILGILGYLIFRPSDRLSKNFHHLDSYSPSRILFLAAQGFEKFSYKYTRILMNDHLRYYVITILSFLVGLLVYFEFSLGSGYQNLVIDLDKLHEITYYEIGIISLMIVAILITVFATTRLAAITALGIVGFTVCIIFVFYSAPDLALTQFSIDTLTVVLFVLILYKLPTYKVYSNYLTRLRDALLSILIGLILTIIIIQVLQQQPNKDIMKYYLDNAYTLAKGKNVVNVILVDFRGMDTMIEIIVLSMSAVGVYSLLKFNRSENEEGSL